MRFDAGLPGRLYLSGLVLAIALAVLALQMLMPGVRILPDILSPVAPATIMTVLIMAIICEYVDSALGMGYGTTLTPLLMILGFDPLQIVPCVLLSEFATGFSAACMHQIDGNVEFIRDREAQMTALLLSVLSAAGAISAVTLAIHISKTALAFVISVIILLVGIVTLATVNRQLRYKKSHIIMLGALAAFNKALSGGGYGPLVTAGQVVSGLAPKKAVAVTSLAESATCIIGLAAYWAAGKGIYLALALPLTMGAMLSVPLATLTVKKAPERLFRMGVGIATCILGAWALLRLL